MMSPDNRILLPREVRRATVKLGQIEIEVVHLDNGQRVITEESMIAFMSWLETADPLDLNTIEGEL